MTTDHNETQDTTTDLDWSRVTDYYNSIRLVPRIPRSRFDVPLYFELPPDQRLSAEDGEVLEQEDYLAVAIIRGRELVLTRHPVLPRGRLTVSLDRSFSVEEVDRGLEEPTSYYDAIADILLAAAFAGWDPQALCRSALAQQQQVQEDAENEARDRQRRRSEARAEESDECDKRGGIERTVDILGTPTPVLVQEGTVWREEVAVSVAENIQSGLNLDRVRAEVDGQQADVVDRGGRIFLRRSPGGRGAAES